MQNTAVTMPNKVASFGSDQASARMHSPPSRQAVPSRVAADVEYSSAIGSTSRGTVLHSNSKHLHHLGVEVNSSTSPLNRAMRHEIDVVTSPRKISTAIHTSPPAASPVLPRKYSHAIDHSPNVRLPNAGAAHVLDDSGTLVSRPPDRSTSASAVSPTIKPPRNLPKSNVIPPHGRAVPLPGRWLLMLRSRPRPHRVHRASRSNSRHSLLPKFINTFASLLEPNQRPLHSGVLHPADPALVEARVQAILQGIRDAANPNARLITHGSMGVPPDGVSSIWKRDSLNREESNRLDLLPDSIIGSRSAALLYMDPEMMREPLRYKHDKQIASELAAQQLSNGGSPQLPVLPFHAPIPHFHTSAGSSLALSLNLADSGKRMGPPAPATVGISSTAQFLHQTDLHLAAAMANVTTSAPQPSVGSWFHTDDAEWKPDAQLSEAAASAAVLGSNQAVPAELVRMHGGLHDMQTQLAVLEQTASRLQAELQADQKVGSIVKQSFRFVCCDLV